MLTCGKSLGHPRRASASAFLACCAEYVYPYMLCNHQAIEFSQSVNKRTQKESPCIIPCFNCIGPVLSFFSLILTSSVMDHFVIVFVMKLVVFVGMLCNCNVRASHLWLIESKAFFTSIHVQYMSFASSSVVLSIIKLSMQPIVFVVHPLRAICMYWCITWCSLS